MTYRIHRSATPDRIVLALSGNMDADHVTRLQELLADEADDHIVLDLKEVTLVDRSAVRFLARIEGMRIRIENCPEYVRSWIVAERSRHEPEEREVRLDPNDLTEL